MVICTRQAPVTDLVKMISATGILKFLLDRSGYNVGVGCVLVEETENDARRFMNAYRRFEDVRIVKSTRDKSLNFEVLLHHCKKVDKDQKIIDFLNKDEGLPVVLVDGIVPEFLRDFENIFLLKSKDMESKIAKIQGDCREFKQYVVREREYVLKKLEVIKKSQKYRDKKELDGRIDFYEMMMAVGEIWKDFESPKCHEEVAEAHLKNFKAFILESIQGAERMVENYGVHEAVREAIFQYVKSKSVKFKNFSEGLYSEKDEEIEWIMYDENGYYFLEKLLRKMCRPLLSNVSFLQLKREMFDDGMIVKHNTKKTNFTVNKVFFDHRLRKAVRTRFIKIPKEYLTSDEGLLLEEIRIENDQEETEEISMERGIEKKGVDKNAEMETGEA